MGDISESPSTYYDILFGTSEKAAYTLQKYLDVMPMDWCFINRMFSHSFGQDPFECKHCPLENDPYGCLNPEKEGWLAKWLNKPCGK